MAKQVTKEQLDLMVDTVKSEIELANELLDSYKEDLENVKNDKSLSESERNKKIEEINKAIKESQDFLNLRKKNLKDIDPNNSGKKANKARAELWSQNEKSGTTLGTVGMEQLWNQRKKQAKQVKHDIENSKDKKSFENKSQQETANNQQNAAEKAKYETIGKNIIEEMNKSSYRVNPITPDLDKKIKDAMAQPEPQPKPEGNRDEEENFDIHLNPGDVDFQGESSSKYGRKLNVPDRYDAYDYDKAAYLPAKVSVWQKIALAIKNFFNRIFNRPIESFDYKVSKYQIENGGKRYRMEEKEDGKKVYKLDKNHIPERKPKRIIRGFSKAKAFFIDHKKAIKRMAIALVAAAGLAVGISKTTGRPVAPSEPIPTPTPTNSSPAEPTPTPETETNKTQDEDVLVSHNTNELTNGSVQKQYVVRGGTTFTESSLGRGARGTLGKDSVVEIFNRAIIKENEDGSKQILANTNGKTWEDYAKDSGQSMDQINEMLQQDGAKEMVAIQVAGTNHHIINTYGWVSTDKLEESSRGTEKLQEFVIGDNAELLQQLQENERKNAAKNAPDLSDR